MAADLAALEASANAGDFSATPVEARLEFGWADAQQRWPRVQGTAAVALPAVCQRCLGLCHIELRVAIDLLLIKSRDTRSADDALEIWELDNELLRPLDIVEEMLVMALPLAPKHRDLAECGGADVVSAQPERISQDRIRPFANLKKDLEQAG
ncbi:MAG: YceD family protein [Woeseia sp.]